MLQRSVLSPDPFEQFQTWYAAALAANLHEPGAMALATASTDGRPSARMVLLRHVDERGFVFYSNTTSRKAADLAENPYAALTFYWATLNRQVRVEGGVEPITVEESDAYFSSRSRGSQLGAWASPQSQVIESRDWLEARLQGLQEEYAGKPVPRPSYWGGYRVVPSLFEFWQSGEHRLHDRFRYRRRANSGWFIERLAP